MALGVANRQGSFFEHMSEFCDKTSAKDSVYAFLRRERDRLFPDDALADSFSNHGRCSAPSSVMATDMALQYLEGPSDRKTAQRYAADIGSYDVGGWTIFAHMVFFNMRERLRNSERPNRVFAVTCDVAEKRDLDSTTLYDAMTTIAHISSVMRNLSKVDASELRDELGSACAAVVSPSNYRRRLSPDGQNSPTPTRGEPDILGD